ncbi:MAG: hypothetical protein WDN46_14090 [Methylocella sp.]
MSPSISPTPQSVTEDDCNEFIDLLVTEAAEGAPRDKGVAMKTLPHFSRAKIAVLNGAPRTAYRMIMRAADLLLNEAAE